LFWRRSSRDHSLCQDDQKRVIEYYGKEVVPRMKHG
jgi:hypothetical protein